MSVKVVVSREAPSWAHAMGRQISGALSSRRLDTFSKTKLPPATPAGQMIFVNDEAGGAVPAFSDGSTWRRVTDRAEVS